MEDDGRSRRLDDDELAEEIALYGDLVVAASEADGVLTLRQIDELLGLDDERATRAGSRPARRRATSR